MGTASQVATALQRTIDDAARQGTKVNLVTAK